MITLACLRHSPTQWNVDKRYQGRADIPLLKQSIKNLRDLSLPSEFKNFNFYASPLKRSQQTLDALNITSYKIADAIIECDFGKWEGMTAQKIKEQYVLSPSGYDGLDTKPHGGESLKDVQERLMNWIKTLDHNSFILSHKCVITALYALATDWEVTGPPQSKLQYDHIQIFKFDRVSLKVEALNKPLVSR